MDAQKFWEQQHDKYAEADWINKPSLFAQWAIDYFPMQGNILDLGAGQGQDSRFFYENGFDVTAIDLSDRAIDLAKQKSPESIEFKKVDLSEPLPFENESFDVIYSHLSLHYFDTPTTEQLFSEMKRVLKLGGVLTALFNSVDDPEAQQGKAIEEPAYREVANLHKRYFSPESAASFAKDFEIVVSDNKGTTYKDRSINVNNLVRLVARKS